MVVERSLERAADVEHEPLALTLELDTAATNLARASMDDRLHAATIDRPGGEATLPPARSETWLGSTQLPLPAGDRTRWCGRERAGYVLRLCRCEYLWPVSAEDAVDLPADLAAL